MQPALKPVRIPLSQLVPSRRNPRRVRPPRHSHETLVSLIRSQGLLQPLVVRPLKGAGKRYEVIAGHRRLRALKEIHREDADTRVDCMLKRADDAEAGRISLGENFAREPMHPLDEAEAFARLATGDGKDAAAIAAEFGVPERYVRQRMKLADLAAEVKTAYRDGTITTAIAEVFASVPTDRQAQVWHEVGGQPRHPDHVRNVIAGAWIDAAHAVFDVAALPESVVSGDLFSERTLVERDAFFAAQSDALAMERAKLLDDGWSQVVVGRYEDVCDQLRALVSPEPEYDEATQRKLEKLADRRRKLEAQSEEVDGSDQKAIERLEQQFDALDAQEDELCQNAACCYADATKSVATVFLLIQPDGRVSREYRVPRTTARASQDRNGSANDASSEGKPQLPTSETLSDRQLAVTFTHEALAVREALLKDDDARRAVLALVLHDQVRAESLAVRHDANGTTLAAGAEGFVSETFGRLHAARAKLDPLADRTYVVDTEAYDLLRGMKPNRLEALIDLLTVSLLTAHLQRPTPLVRTLAQTLRVNLRDHWRPDASWLGGYQKVQLAHLLIALLGPVHAPPPTRKKSELVDQLARLFSDAAQGTLDDPAAAARLNAWLPSNLRPAVDADAVTADASEPAGR